MSVSYWQDNSRQTADTAFDVVIIGAGISGAASAYWLKDSGLRVAVVEKGDVCAGASGRNAGFITCGSVEHFSRQAATHGEEKALDLWRMSQENLTLIEEHLVADGLACDYRRAGTYSLAGSPHEMDVLRATAGELQGHGVRVEVVDESHVQDALGARGFYGGVLYQDDGEVHPVKLVRGMLDRSGATVFPHHSVWEITSSGDGVEIKTQNRTFSAAIAIMATNGYSAQLHPWFEGKIYPTRGQIIVTEPVAPFMSAPCYCNFVLDYFRQLPDGRVLIGGFRQLGREEEKGTNDHIHPEIHQALEDFLNTHFAALEGVKITHRWAGTMGFSQDSLPMIGSLPAQPNIYFVGGYTGHGIGWGFKAGQLLARLVLHGETPPHISARRFRS